MNILKNINDLADEKVALAIGNFDGCHKGHQHLIKALLEEAREINANPVLLTFNPHPQVYFNPERAFLLDSRSEKISKFEEIGIKTILEIEFTSEIQGLKAKTFLEEYLLKIKNLSLVLLGHDFALGSGKEKARDILSEIAPDSLVVKSLDPVLFEDIVVSSTLIRDKIRKGEVNAAAKLLGQEFRLSGNIVAGVGIGKKELVATANLNVASQRIIPARGVYFTTCLLGNKTYPAITNIGSNPTIDKDQALSVETHILDFNEDIYGKKISLVFHKKCRDEKKFNNLEELKAEIEKNIESRRLFKC